MPELLLVMVLTIPENLMLLVLLLVVFLLTLLNLLVSHHQEPFLLLLFPLELVYFYLQVYHKELYFLIQKQF